MYNVTAFYLFEIVTADYRLADEQRSFATWPEVEAYASQMRDWGNVRNVGQGAMLSEVLIRVSKDDSQGWAWNSFTAEGSGYFDNGSGFFRHTGR